MKKFAVIGVSLLLALAVMAYVFLDGRPAKPGDKSVVAPAEEPASLGGLPDAESASSAEKSGQKKSLASEERPPGWTSDKKGALTYFELTDGEIGYVDVNSLMRDRDPHSVIALLQDHHGLTGAGEWLEIELGSTKENKIWGYRTRFTQLIEGIPTQWGGTILFSSSGAVGMLHGDLVNPQALGANSVIVQRPEAEAIAYEAAFRYAAKLPHGANLEVTPELRGLPLKIEVGSPEWYRDMRYELDPNDELRRVWWVGVGISGPKRDSAIVVISAETRKVLDVRSILNVSPLRPPNLHATTLPFARAMLEAHCKTVARA